MRTFPYRFALAASLLTACATAPQPQPEAAPSGVDAVHDAELERKMAPLVDAILFRAQCSPDGKSAVRKENLIELLARAARFLEKHAGPVTPSQPR